MPQWTIVELNGGEQPVCIEYDDERENDCNTWQGVVHLSMFMFVWFADGPLMDHCNAVLDWLKCRNAMVKKKYEHKTPRSRDGEYCFRYIYNANRLCMCSGETLSIGCKMPVPINWIFYWLLCGQSDGHLLKFLVSYCCKHTVRSGRWAGVRVFAFLYVIKLLENSLLRTIGRFFIDITENLIIFKLKWACIYCSWQAEYTILIRLSYISDDFEIKLLKK